MARDNNPTVEFKALTASLASSGLARGYVLRGEEVWFRDRARRRIEALAREQGLEIRAHDAKDPDFDVQPLHADLRGGSLFASSVCTILENPLELLKKLGTHPSPVMRSVLSFLESDREGCVVLVAASMRADHAALKAVRAAGGGVHAFRRLFDSPTTWEPDPRRTELVQWMLALARSTRVPLDPDQAAYLAAATGNDLYGLQSQLEKLRTGGDRDVQDLAGLSAAGVPFRAARSVAEGNLRQALEGIETLFQGGFKARDGRRECNESAILAFFFGSLRGEVRRALSVERGEAKPDRRGLPQGSRSAPEWRALYEDAALLERRTRDRYRVDASDLAAFALRWCKAPRARSRAAH